MKEIEIVFPRNLRQAEKVSKMGVRRKMIVPSLEDVKYVYVAGPFRSKDGWELAQNVNQAECRGMAIAREGYIPIIPHSMYRNFDRTFDDQFWLDATIGYLEMCQGITVVGDWLQSTGTLGELIRSADKGLYMIPGEKWVCEPDELRMYRSQFVEQLGKLKGEQDG